MQQVALVGDADHPPVPEVMVRIAEGDSGFDGIFLGQGQPVIVTERHAVTSQFRDGAGAIIPPHGDTHPFRKIGRPVSIYRVFRPVIYTDIRPPWGVVNE